MSGPILCAIDINDPESDKKVLQVANELAILRSAQLDVVTVVPDNGSNLVGGYLQDHQVTTAKDWAKSVLDNFVSLQLGESRNSEIRHLVASGTVYAEVLKLASIDLADLIVIGAHREDLKDFLLGPNAARVVRHAECSVYVVR